MKLFGLPVPFTGERKKALSSVSEGRGGWYPLIREAFAGAWQRNITIDRNAVLAHHAVFSCLTLIASDISKLRVKLMKLDGDGIWSETSSAAYSPVLRRPNNYQNRIQFWESWMLSKFGKGNTVVLKERDARNVVVALHVLDWTRVKPLVADDGSVFYQLDADNISGIESSVIVPAREIIHDRMNCLFHPLIGVSPIYANAMAATQGLNIQTNSIRLFENNSSPGGILTAPGEISDATAERLKTDWEENFSGKNFGRVAVLGDGLKFEKMALTAVEGQLIEQLKWTAEVVCSTFHVPPYKLGIGPMPTNNNVQALNLEYYTQALQSPIEAAELCLDEGLEMAADIGTEFDLDGLLRMDSVTQVATLKEAVGAAIMAPNEARKKLDLKPVAGGNSPMIQEQNFSLEAIAKRDALPDPWASKNGAAAASGKSPPVPANSDEDIAAAKQVAVWKLKSLLAKAA
ncbi:HK97 family phage portal protein [Nitrobacteraceae bacterium AZCC 1564]